MKVRKTIYIDEKDYKNLKSFAALYGNTISDFIIVLLKEKLKRDIKRKNR